MSEQVQFELRAIDADVAGELLGCTARTVLEKHACREEFPERVSLRPATWVAGKVLEYREKIKAGRPVRPRRSRSKSSAT